MASTKKKYEAAKKAFDKANKVAVDAHAAFLKADADSNTTRQKIDKVFAANNIPLRFQLPSMY